MSFTAIRAAFIHIETTEMGIPSKIVLLTLANHHNQETGRCDPSISRLSKMSGISERAVRNALRELEALKLITTVERKQRTGRGRRNLTNRYRLKGGAQYAGRVGHNMPTKQEYTPSAYDTLANSVELLDTEGRYD